MPTEKFIHSMKDLCEEMDKRIAKLEGFRYKLQEKVDKGVGVAKNAESLKRVSNSLTHAKDARRAMESSCCIYSCEFDLEN